MKRINYESDFKIVEGFADGTSIVAAPFRFTYYTKVARGTYVAEYDGSEFKNCIPTEDGRVVVPFNAHTLGTGVLNVKREFFLNDADFEDGVCNLVSVESTGITLDKGATDDLGEIEVMTSKPYLVVGEGGVSGEIANGSITEAKLANNAVSTAKIKDGAVTTNKVADNAITEAKLSADVRAKLNSSGGGSSFSGSASDVTYSGTTGLDGDNVQDALDGVGTRLSSLEESSGESFSGDYEDLLNKPSIPTKVTDLEDGGEYAKKSDLPTDYATKDDIPTKTSQLTNDSGFLTEHQDLSGKQDVIADLDAIRENAALGATALQSVPSEYVTETELAEAIASAITTTLNTEV